MARHRYRIKRLYFVLPCRLRGTYRSFVNAWRGPLYLHPHIEHSLRRYRGTRYDTLSFVPWRSNAAFPRTRADGILKFIEEMWRVYVIYSKINLRIKLLSDQYLTGGRPLILSDFIRLFAFCFCTGLRIIPRVPTRSSMIDLSVIWATGERHWNCALLGIISRLMSK